MKPVAILVSDSGHSTYKVNDSLKKSIHRITGFGEVTVTQWMQIFGYNKPDQGPVKNTSDAHLQC